MDTTGWQATARGRFATGAAVAGLAWALIASLVFPIAPASAQAVPSPPATVTVTRTTDSLTVSWSQVDIATGFNVNLSANGGGSWHRVGSGVTGTSYTVTRAVFQEFDRDATYIAAVQSQNAGGVGGWKNSAPSAPLPLPVAKPAPPASVTAARTAGGVLKITWTAPPSNGSGPILGYDVNYSQNWGGSWARAATDATGMSTTVSGVTNSNGVIASVRARGSAGHSGWRNSASVPGVGVPASVTGYRGSDFLDVEWPAVPGATGYDVNWHHVGRGWSRAATNVSGTSYRITDPGPEGIPNVNSHLVAVRARNSGGPGGWKNSAPVPSAQHPKRLTQLAASRSGDTVTVRWNQCDIEASSCHRGSPVTAWWVEFSSDDGSTWTRKHTLTSYTALSDVDIDVSGVPASALQRVRVSTRNRVGGLWVEALVSGTAAPLAAPTVQAYRGRTFIDAEWNAVTGATSYEVRYRRTGGSWTTAAASTASTSLRIPVSGHHSTGEFVVSVRARVGVGAGHWGNSATVGPANHPQNAQNLTATRHTAGQLDVTWTNCTADTTQCHGGSPVTQYAINLSADKGWTWTRAKTVPASSFTSGDTVTLDSGVNDARAYLVAVSVQNRVGGGWVRTSVPAETGVTLQTPRHLTTTVTFDGAQGTAGFIWEKPSNASAADAFAYEIECSAYYSGNDWSSTVCPDDVASTADRHNSVSVTYDRFTYNAPRARIRATRDGESSLWVNFRPEPFLPIASGAQDQDGTLRVWWDRNAFAVGAYAYDVQCTASTASPFTWTTCHTQAASTSTRFMTEPTASGTVTSVRLRSRQGPRVSNWVTIGVPAQTPPSAPGSVTASSATQGSTVTYTVTWTKPSNTAARPLSYIVHCSDDNGATWSYCTGIDATASTSLSATATRTTSQTGYTHVRVRAGEGFYFGAWSSVTAVT